MKESFAHRAVAVGGTFDLLHVGHQRLLRRAFSLGRFVFVGVSGDLLVSKLHKGHVVQSFEVRKRNVQRFVKSQGWQERARIVELKDSFGPAATRRLLDALVVSEETRSSGILVNALRRRRDLPPLKLYTLRLVKGEDGTPVSSTKIRLGEMDSSGRTILNPTWKKKRA